MNLLNFMTFPRLGLLHACCNPVHKAHVVGITMDRPNHQERERERERARARARARACVCEKF